MDIDIGADVLTNDGKKVGSVERVVIDPLSYEVTDIVVHTDAGRQDDYIVSVSEIDAAEHGEVTLRVNADQLRQMPHFVEAEFEVPPPGGAEVLAYNPGNIVVPVKPPFPPPYPVPPPPPPLPELAREVGAAPLEISEGTEVEAVDGPIGTVDEVLLDTYQDRITALVVRKNDLLGTDVVIPVEWVSEISLDRVKVAATRAQVEHLLGPPAGWYLSTLRRQRRKSK